MLYIDYSSLIRLTFSHNSVQSGSGLRIENCKWLEEINIGDDSFSEMSGRLELFNLPSLQYVRIGKKSLRKMSKVLTSNLPSLVEMSIGEASLISFTE